MINLTTDRSAEKEYDYELEGDTLTIRYNAAYWTIDLLPTSLRDIFHALWLEDAERIKNIHLRRQ